MLVQTGRQLIPTPRALQLAPEVRMVLLQIESRVMARSSFDPATSQRVFRIMASDYVLIVLLADALAEISKIAPGLSFEIMPAGNHPADVIDGAEADLLIMPEVYVSKGQPTAHLFDDGYVCVVDQSNSRVGDSLTFEEYLQHRHVVVQFASRRRPAFEDWFLDRFGTARQIEIIASSYAVVPYLVAGTGRIATLHASLAHRYLNLGLRMVPPPLDIPQIREVIQWHAMNSQDDGLMWVRDRLLQAAAPLFQRGTKGRPLTAMTQP